MRILGSLKRLIAKILMGFGYQIVNASANNYEEFVKISENTRVEHFKCDVRNGLENNIYMEIGSNSLVSGNYIFETLSGKITIGDNTFVGGGMFICIDGIEIGNDVMISWGCTFMDNDSHSLIWKERESDVRDWKQGVDEGSIGKYVNWQNVKREKIVVKDKAWIGFNSIILKGVTIGEGAVVGAGSVVTKDVPDFSVVAGNPARIIKYTT